MNFVYLDRFVVTKNRRVTVCALFEGTSVHRTEGHDHDGAAGIAQGDVGDFVYVRAEVVMHTDDRVFQTGDLEIRRTMCQIYRVSRTCD